DDIAEMYNYQTIITNTENDPEKERDSFLSLVSKQVDGVVFLGGALNEETLTDIKDSHVPVVICGTSEKDKNLPSVNIDYFEAIKEATTKFLDTGAERIAFLKASYSDQLENHIEEGIKSAYRDTGKSSDDSLIFTAGSDYQSGTDGFERSNAPKADGVSPMNDDKA